MTNNITAPLAQLDITHKGVLQTRIQSAALKGRERQFMLLLLRNDEISKQACLAMLPKIDVDSLIARGFLKYNESEGNVSAPFKKSERDDDMDPILQLAAGTVW